MSQPILRDTLFTEFDKIKQRLDTLEHGKHLVVSSLPASGYDGAIVFKTGTISGNLEMYRWDVDAAAWENVKSPIVSAKVYLSPAQSIATGTSWTVINYNAEAFDYGGFHDNSTNNSRLTAPAAGIYTVSLSAAWASNSSGLRAIAFRKNGTTYFGTRYDQAAGTSNATISEIVYLASGDYVETMVWQTSGGNLNFDTQPDYAGRFSIAKIG